MRQKIALLLLIIGCSPPTIDVSKSVPPPPLPEPQYGTLSIDSIPPATNIYIDGLHIDGATPLTVTLLAKDHIIELHRLFYQNFATAITIIADKHHSVSSKLVSSLYPYTGDWRDEFPNVLPGSADIIDTTLDLYVIDNKIFGTDLVLINGIGRGSGNCAGTIDPTNNYAEMLCSYKSDIDDYWRNARYTIEPRSAFKILVQSIYIDSNNRLFLGTEMIRKN